MNRTNLAFVMLLAGVIPNTSARADDAIFEQAHSLATKTFKDPMSAEFRNELAYKAEKKDGTVDFVVCGEVNAKNSYGGYVGFTPYYVNGSDVSIRSDENKDFFDIGYSFFCETLPKSRPVTRPSNSGSTH
ncbi:MAG: hypothetical protein WC426_05390 [Sulfuriferula sp.]